jgi:phosphoglycerate dehydrogenase-like enzyme
MKAGAVLINGSRGGVVDEKALYDALASGHLGAAASDVFEKEPTPPDHPLLQLPNFIGTPHMAGRSRRNSPRQLEQALQNINRFLEGERPERLVNPEIYDSVGGVRL